MLCDDHSIHSFLRSLKHFSKVSLSGVGTSSLAYRSATHLALNLENWFEIDVYFETTNNFSTLDDKKSVVFFNHHGGNNVLDTSLCGDLVNSMYMTSSHCVEI